MNQDWTTEQDKEFGKRFENVLDYASNRSLVDISENVLDYIHHREALLIERMEGKLDNERKSKDEAYHERNMLVCALSKLFPSYIARHDEDNMGWERDWMWIVYIELPTGQVSWHMHDSEVQMFNHLRVQENKWDGHNTERKYERLGNLGSSKIKVCPNCGWHNTKKV